jgi:hypothetical protein
MTQAWDERERRATSERDVALIDTLNSARALVATSVPTSGPPSKDFWSACANLGRLYAEHGASIDFAARSLTEFAAGRGESASPWLEPARSTLLESFMRELEFQRERTALAAQAQALLVLRAGEFGLYAPNVPVAHDLQAWADAAITYARKRGAKILIVQGETATIQALTDSASIAGIRVLNSPTRSWFGFR